MTSPYENVPYLETLKEMPLHSVKIDTDSAAPDGTRITTFIVRYQRFCHSEVMTHRVFSRNASSSRAIPVKKMRAQVKKHPALPVHWGSNRPGMQATDELKGWRKFFAKILWKSAGKMMARYSWAMEKVGLHKQVANRILEPWQFISVVITATDFDNFFTLRAHPMAQPEFQTLAYMMKAEMAMSTPNPLKVGDWHIPLVSFGRRAEIIANYKVQPCDPATVTNMLDDFLAISTANCARTSYNNHDGTASTLQEDVKLRFRLIGAEPRHSSPTEHQAKCIGDGAYYANFKSFRSYRHHLESNETPTWDLTPSTLD